MQKRILTTAAALGAGALTVGVLGSTAGADDHGLTPLGVYESGLEGGSEIVAVDTGSDRMFITNGAENQVDIVDISDPDTPTLVDSVAVDGGLQSVAVGDGLVAAAVAGPTGLSNGSVVTFDVDGNPVGEYEVGVLPDSIAFTDDGRYIVVANEAEPVCDDDDVLGDPEGSISIIDTWQGVVRTADFTRWNGKEDALRAQGVRIFFPGSSASQDLEPEYVAIEGNQAYVTLQEANAVAVVNIKAAKVTKIIPLGYKDHSLEGNGLDPSNRDDAEAIANWNVLGMYMPDAIALTDIGGEKYYLTANEGDSRDYDCYSEEVRVGDFDPDEELVLDDGTLVTGLAAPLYTADDLDNERLGRLKTTTAFPTTANDDGEITQIYSYGARSFTIWNPAGQVVFDSGDDFGELLVGTPYFNADDGETDGRSDDKGAEPEALAVGKVDGRTYAFIGLERSSGIMMYDITEPAEAFFVDYVNTDTDISPEGIAFVPATESPTGTALLAVAHEVSGTTRLFEIG